MSINSKHCEFHCHLIVSIPVDKKQSSLDWQRMCQRKVFPQITFRTVAGDRNTRNDTDPGAGNPTALAGLKLMTVPVEHSERAQIETQPAPPARKVIASKEATTPKFSVFVPDLRTKTESSSLSPLLQGQCVVQH